MAHTDGFFSESGSPSGQHLTGLLTAAGKPAIHWIAQDKLHWDHWAFDTSGWLQQLLYYGAFPMLPLDRQDHGPSFALSTRRYPFVWVKGVLNGYSSTRVSLWDSLVFGRVLEY